MGKLDDFLDVGGQPEREKPFGIEWFAAVRCQVCNEEVEEQILYPAECILVWKCSHGHRSHLENYRVF